MLADARTGAAADPCVIRTLKAGLPVTSRLLITVAVLLMGLVQPAASCVCVEMGDLPAIVRDSSAVFLGRVVAFRIVAKRVQGTLQEDTEVTFAVDRRWKGATRRSVKVRTCGTERIVCTCGAHFELGYSYVVFASGNPLETTSCHPNEQFEGAEDLITRLDSLAVK